MATTTTIHAPKHMRKSEPKAELHELEKAWRIAYVCECCAEDKATRDTAKALRKFIEQEQAQQTPEPTPKPTKPAKAKAAAPANWWDEWFTQPWVKATQCKASSCIVKMHCDGGHGAELRPAGWQYSPKSMPVDNDKRVAGYWWAYKDANRAKQRGERYLANKAARAEQAAAC